VGKTRSWGLLVAASLIVALWLAASANAAVTFSRTDYVLAQATGSTHPPLIGESNPQLNQGLVAADLNKDGKPDLVAADSQYSKVYVLLNNGDGSFSPATGSPFDTVCHQPTSLAAANVDGDGNPDVVVGCEDSGIRVLLGDGHGGLADSGQQVLAGYGPLIHASVDGLDDLVYNSIAVNAVCWVTLSSLTHSPSPSCGNAADRSAITTWDAPVHWYESDCGGDEFLTFTYPDPKADASLTVLAGSPGCGSFETGTYRDSGISPTDSPTGVSTADLENNGMPDIVMSSATGFHILTGWNSTTGVGTTPANISSAGAVAGFGLADVSGDGNRDLVGVEQFPPAYDHDIVAVHTGHGNATQFDAAQTFSVFGNQANYSTPPQILVADLNGDGRPDVVTSGTGCDIDTAQNCATDLTVLLNGTIGSGGGGTGGPGGGSSGSGSGGAAFAGIKLHSGIAAVSKSGKVILQLGCPLSALVACTGTDTLSLLGAFKAAGRHGNLKIGSARFSIPVGRTKKVAIRLTSRARTALRRAQSLKVLETVVVHDARHVPRRTTAKLTLKLAHKR
jgi:hypothetical protein